MGNNYIYQISIIVILIIITISIIINNKIDIDISGIKLLFELRNELMSREIILTIASAKGFFDINNNNYYYWNCIIQ